MEPRTPTRLDQLALESRTSPEARAALVTECLPWIRSLARSRCRTPTAEDVTQDLCIELMRCVDRYDPDKASFTHYARRVLRSHVLSRAGDTERPVYEPRRRLQARRNARAYESTGQEERALEALRGQLSSQEPVFADSDDLELAEELDLTDLDVKRWVESLPEYEGAVLRGLLAGFTLRTIAIRMRRIDPTVSLRKVSAWAAAVRQMYTEAKSAGLV